MTTKGEPKPKKETLQDGSKRFIMRGGPADGMTVRLFPQNDGWLEVLLQGRLYTAPFTQDPKKPYMNVSNR